MGGTGRPGNRSSRPNRHKVRNQYKPVDGFADDCLAYLGAAPLALLLARLAERR
jgi:hypothetical protein